MNKKRVREKSLFTLLYCSSCNSLTKTNRRGFLFFFFGCRFCSSSKWKLLLQLQLEGRIGTKKNFLPDFKRQVFFLLFCSRACYMHAHTHMQLNARRIAFRQLYCLGVFVSVCECVSVLFSHQQQQRAKSSFLIWGGGKSHRGWLKWEANESCSRKQQGEREEEGMMMRREDSRMQWWVRNRVIKMADQIKETNELFWYPFFLCSSGFCFFP